MEQNIISQIDKETWDPILWIDFNNVPLNEEFMWYLDAKPQKKVKSPKNFIIKFFQQYPFYVHENLLFEDENIQYKLIMNRCKYLNKTIDELTVMDLLDGFKKSGIWYGYSHFNPLLFRWFIHEYNCQICYDPCGGWGHRLLGAVDLKKYIYNDYSPTVVYNVERMVDFFDYREWMDVVLYNEDSRYFVPTEEDFDSMFTCPPYMNLEEYECGSFKDEDDYNLLIDNLFNVFYQKKNCKVFGLVIREDLLPEKYHNFTRREDIDMKKAEHLLKNKKKRYKEYLYIYEK